MKPSRRFLILACLMIGAPAVVSAPSISAAPSRAEVERAQERLHELERDFQLISERYNLVNERFEKIQVKIAVTAKDVDRIESRLGIKQDAAVRLARALYKGGSMIGVETILASESINEVETRFAYLKASQSEQVEVFERLDVERKVLARLIEDLERARSSAQREKQRLEELRVEAEAKIEAQRDEVAELNELIEAAHRRAQRRRQEAAAAVSLPAPPSGISADPAPPPNARAGMAVDAALSQTGKPYQWGAAGPDSYDCSGLTMWAWAQAGVSLPHNSGSQYAATPRVDGSDWQPGDLLFFGSPIHHVGMYIGNGQMVEAPYSGQTVRVVPASRSDYVGAGRPGT